MSHHQSSILVGLFAVCVAAVAVGQNTPTAPASSDPQGSMSNGSQTNQPSSSADKISAQDPKMKACISTEKGKNTGKSDEQIKQTCMLQLASHQGK